VRQKILVKNLSQRLSKTISSFEGEGRLRKLCVSTQGRVDLFSSDYLGVANNALIQNYLDKNALPLDKNRSHGSTGSRLLSGNSELYVKLEELLADFYQAEEALIFNSGYAANLGLLSALPERKDTILYDNLVHASIRDGIRLSPAKSFHFKHNSLKDLERLLKISSQSSAIYIVVESIYSMDGDIAPIMSLVELAEYYNACLIIDEAHAVGVYGESGSGIVDFKTISQRCDLIKIATFGKAFACHGAAILGAKPIKQYLINTARSLIYSTALPEISLAAIYAAHQLVSKAKKERDELAKLVTYFISRKRSLKKDIEIRGEGHIQLVMLPSSDQAKKMAEIFQKSGFECRAILYPTIAKGEERVRLSLHSFNTKEEIDHVLHYLSKDV